MSRRRVIGLVPAAGRASRLGQLPCSKEVFPLGWRQTPTGPRARVACEFVLESLRRGGVDSALMVLRAGKWDIPATLGGGETVGLPLAYAVVEATGSVLETLDAAYPWVAGATVALGFPDMVLEPPEVYSRLLDQLARQRGEGEELAAVLALMPTDRPAKTDMVAVDRLGRVQRIDVKPPASELRWAWACAVWTPLFSEFLHRWLGAGASTPPAGRELQVGDALQAAIADGLRVDGVPFPSGHFLDIGTPGDLRRATRRFAQEMEGSL